MPRSHAPLVLIGIALAASLAAGAAAHSAQWANSAHPGQPPTIVGAYTLNQAASEDVHAAIDAAVRSMNFVARPVARGRLRRTNVPAQRLVIALPSDSIAVTFDRDAPLVSPAGGAEVRWRGPDGDDLGLSMRLVDGRLEQRLVAEDGVRTNVFALSPGGRTLTWDVTITSPRLPQPLTYRLVYERS